MNNKDIALKVLSIMPEIRKIFDEKEVEIEEKTGIGNLVTSTDKKIEEYIKDVLTTMFPESQIIAEESAQKTIENDKASLKFIVDPLDGTTNYTNGWPHSVAIGIANNNELAGGVIYDVLYNRVYIGIKDNGVFSCDINDILFMEKVEIAEHKTENIKKAVISYDTPYGAEAFKTTLEMVKNLYHSGASIKTVGPISLDIVKTALGKENRPNDYNDAVWHAEVRAWDLAASTAILREMGGEIIGRDGKPLSVETLTSPTEKIAFIASGNKRMLEKLYEVYKESAGLNLDSRNEDENR